MSIPTPPPPPNSGNYTPRKRQVGSGSSTSSSGAGQFQSGNLGLNNPGFPVAPGVTPTNSLQNIQGGEPLASQGARLAACVLEVLFAAVTLGLGWLIWSLIVWGKGTTPGHQVLRIYVVDLKSGQTATWGHMALREFVIKGIVGNFASLVTFGIYFIVDSLFIVREDRRTLHDLMSSTLVVQR